MKRNTPIYRVVKKMRSTGNAQGVVAEWFALVASWANTAAGPDAAAVKAMLPAWQARPFYTAAELAPMMPALMVGLGVVEWNGRMPPVMGAARLAYQLDFAGLPSHVVADGTRYFIVEATHRAAEMVPMIEEFHNAQHG